MAKYDLRKLSLKHAAQHYPDVYAKIFEEDIRLNREAGILSEEDFKMEYRFCLECAQKRCDFYRDETVWINIPRCFVSPWHLDTHSTILSRQTSYHWRKGKFNYVKAKKISYPTRRLNPILRLLHSLRSHLPRSFRFLLPLRKRYLYETTARIRQAAKTGELEYRN
jgi:hypothetical protein